MGVVIGIWWFWVHLTAGQKHIGPVDSKLVDYWLHSCPAVPSYPTVGRFILLVRISNRWIVLDNLFMRKHKSLDCTTDRWTVSISGPQRTEDQWVVNWQTTEHIGLLAALPESTFYIQQYVDLYSLVTVSNRWIIMENEVMGL
jgi:hypothetical protein